MSVHHFEKSAHIRYIYGCHFRLMNFFEPGHPHQDFTRVYHNYDNVYTFVGDADDSGDENAVFDVFVFLTQIEAFDGDVSSALLGPTRRKELRDGRIRTNAYG